MQFVSVGLFNAQAARERRRTAVDQGNKANAACGFRLHWYPEHYGIDDANVIRRNNNFHDIVHVLPLSLAVAAKVS